MEMLVVYVGPIQRPSGGCLGPVPPAVDDCGHDGSVETDVWGEGPVNLDGIGVDVDEIKCFSDEFFEHRVAG